MKDPKRVFVCIVLHHSDELRPQGGEAAVKFINAWRKHSMPYSLVVVDNASTYNFKCLSEVDHHFIRVDDQSKTGITGAWNLAIKFAYDQGAEIITGFSDDVEVDDTFHAFIDAIQDDNTIYGPLSTAPTFVTEQTSRKIRPGSTVDVKVLHGFWLGFTRGFFETKHVEWSLFDTSVQNTTRKVGRWGGQEYMMEVWKRKHQTVCRVVGDCLLHHSRINAWSKAHRKYE